MKIPKNKFLTTSERFRASELSETREATDTFQGRPIVQIPWLGEQAEAVEGLLAYCAAAAGELVNLARFEAILGESIAEHGPVDRLGIGVLFKDKSPVMELIAAVDSALRPYVQWTEPVLLDQTSLTPNDPSFPQQWGLKSIKAERAWELWKGNPDRVVLAVLDSGLPLENGVLSHEDLNDPNRIFRGNDLVNKDGDPADDNGHGTHVLGIAAATKDNSSGVSGLWPGSVLAIKVFNSFGKGSSETFKDGILQAIDFAAEREARLVVNYSGRGPASETKKAAIRLARDKGALVVAGAGNDNLDKVKFPAAYSSEFDNVIAVAAIDSHRERAGFSNRGPQLTVAAPGVGILSTMPNYPVPRNIQALKYLPMDGTSMASPFVAALAALVWSKSPDLAADQVRELIASTADPVPGRELEFGRGIINAERALM